MKIIKRKLKGKIEEFKKNREMVAEEVAMYRQAYQSAVQKERLKQIPDLAKKRVEREMENKLNKEKGGAMQKVGEVLAAGNRMSEALVGKPGEGIPSQEELNKRRWLNG